MRSVDSVLVLPLPMSPHNTAEEPIFSSNAKAPKIVARMPRTPDGTTACLNKLLISIAPASPPNTAADAPSVAPIAAADVASRKDLGCVEVTVLRAEPILSRKMPVPTVPPKSGEYA